MSSSFIDISDCGLKIKYPKDWKPELKKNIWGSCLSIFPENNSKNETKVSIRVEELRGEMRTLEIYINQLKASFINNNEEAKIIEQIDDTLLLKTKASKVIYEFKRENKTIKKMSITTLRNKKAYTLFYEAEISSFSKFESVVTIIANSLEYTDIRYGII